MTMADRLTVAGVGVVLGFIGAFAYMAARPVIASWVDIVVVGAIFTGFFLPTVLVAGRKRPGPAVR